MKINEARVEMKVIYETVGDSKNTPRWDGDEDLGLPNRTPIFVTTKIIEIVPMNAFASDYITILWDKTKTWYFHGRGLEELRIVKPPPNPMDRFRKLINEI